MPDRELRGRLERLQALRSAWGVLAPSGLSGSAQAVADTGRELGESVARLLAGAAQVADPAAVAALDARLDEFERELREIALEVPVAQLRSTLPERVGSDRRGVLDLLDLLLGAEVAGTEGTSARIPKLDYLITLLCTGGDPDAPLQDPVTLTRRLHALCESAAANPDPRVPELEAEFFAAADLRQGDAREEVELRTLRRRKMELGPLFFAPGVLRAVITYNAALLRHIDEEVLNAQDWGLPPSAEAPEEEVSLFESPTLPKLVEALRRRTAGEPPAHDPLDRIAWCLDLSDLSVSDQRALLAGDAGSREDLKATTILVGLLCRSAVVLADEFPAIGIAPEQLSGAWLAELDDAFQKESNRRIAADDYQGACDLSDLKSRFLSGAKGGSRRPRSEPAAAPASGDAGEQASSAKPRAGREAGEPKPGRLGEAFRDWPWARLAGLAGGAALLAIALLGLHTYLADTARVDGDELTAVSAFLADGKRNGKGRGQGFVGTLEPVWLELEPAEQELAAGELVDALRARGVREIMIYDDERRLRIQAFGNGPPRVVAAAGSH
ncbi:MAG: hypothetical protein QNK04_14175 [Myxococcota bacterium]|nr:hypothetical protein [Myxococcota bacterium]